MNFNITDCSLEIGSHAKFLGGFLQIEFTNTSYLSISKLAKFIN